MYVRMELARAVGKVWVPLAPGDTELQCLRPPDAPSPACSGPPDGSAVQQAGSCSDFSAPWRSCEGEGTTRGVMQSKNIWSPWTSEHHGAVSPPCEPTAEEDTGLRHGLSCGVLSTDGNGRGWGTKPMGQRQC